MLKADDPFDTALPRHEARLGSETLVEELAALRARVEELERAKERPGLDLHPFKNECNSNVSCSTKDGKIRINIGGRVEQDWL